MILSPRLFLLGVKESLVNNAFQSACKKVVSFSLQVLLCIYLEGYERTKKSTWL